MPATNVHTHPSQSTNHSFLLKAFNAITAAAVAAAIFIIIPTPILIFAAMPILAVAAILFCIGSIGGNNSTCHRAPGASVATSSYNYFSQPSNSQNYSFYAHNQPSRATSVPLQSGVIGHFHHPRGLGNNIHGHCNQTPLTRSVEQPHHHTHATTTHHH